MPFDNIFEEKFFEKASKGFKQVKKVSDYTSTSTFEQKVNENIINFNSLYEKDKKAKVVNTVYGYSVKLSKPHLAFNLHSILAEDNLDLSFTQDLLEFDPDEELIKKSKIPLWVVKPKGNKVFIKRVW